MGGHLRGIVGRVHPTSDVVVERAVASRRRDTRLPNVCVAESIPIEKEPSYEKSQALHGASVRPGTSGRHGSSASASWRDDGRDYRSRHRQHQGVLPGVTVTVSGPALMGTRTDVTDAEGKYRVPALPPGSDYVVAVRAARVSQRSSAKAIRLDVGFTATINVTMSPAGLTETVTVSGASPVSTATASQVATHLNAEQITRTLVGSRDYAAVMAQMPGS